MCGIPLLKPRPGWVRGIVMGGVYRRHPLTGDREHHFSPPNQGDGDTWPEGGESQEAVLKGARVLTTGENRSEWREGSAWDHILLEAHGDPMYSACVPCVRDHCNKCRVRLNPDFEVWHVPWTPRHWKAGYLNAHRIFWFYYFSICPSICPLV